jgi:hypothetical protein
LAYTPPGLPHTPPGLPHTAFHDNPILCVGSEFHIPTWCPHKLLSGLTFLSEAAHPYYLTPGGPKHYFRVTLPSSMTPCSAKEFHTPTHSNRYGLVVRVSTQRLGGQRLESQPRLIWRVG